MQGQCMIKIIAAIFSTLVCTSWAGPSIVLVLTNTDGFLNDGKKIPTGFFLSEAAHPYAEFVKAGYEVKLASPKGGFAPVDPKSIDLKDPQNESFWKKHGKEGTNGRSGVPDTAALSDLKPADFAGIYFAGGHGTVWDFPNQQTIANFATKIYADGGVIGAVCHGPAALVGMKNPSGKPLVAGKKVAVFTNAEEAAVKLTKAVPFLLQIGVEKFFRSVECMPPHETLTIH